MTGIGKVKPVEVAGNPWRKESMMNMRNLRMKRRWNRLMDQLGRFLKIVQRSKASHLMGVKTAQRRVINDLMMDKKPQRQVNRGEVSLLQKKSLDSHLEKVEP